jgi:PAS domain S-box-containing protein
MRHENAVKNLTIKNQRYILMAVALIGLLLFTLVFFFYSRLRINKKARALLENSNKAISDQKDLLEQSINELKVKEQRYHALASSIQDGLIILQDEKLVYINEAMHRMLGYKSKEELLAKEPNEIIATADFEMVAKNYSDRITGKKVSENYPIKLLDNLGNPIAVSIRVTLTTLNDKPAVIGTIKDESETRNFEKKLIEEKQKAEKATVSKSMFLAGMSHEIRNQMNSLMGIADVLADTSLSDEQKQYLEVIKNSGDKLLNIINDILDMSKIEAGQVVLDPVLFSPRELLRDVMALHDLDARQKGLYLRGVVNPEIPEHLSGDANRLSQVLTNLIGNAIKFTDAGGVEVVIAQEKQTKKQVRLKISVTDTGIGVSKNSLDKLFKPFSQTHAAVERKSEGSGLGLAISKNLVDLMGGNIGVNTREGSGSTFWFTVQLLKPGESESNKPSKINKSKNNNRILLVEDNLLNQHLTTNILSREGYIADIASNGQEGVNLFKKSFYPVILMDIQMPVMDGIEATRKIRDFESGHYPDRSKIIAVSAHTKEGEQQQLLDAGLDDFIQKPFNPEQLLKLIRDRKHS